ncbi:MAG: FliA/WhiG family RNA polymerase sigma factor [Acidobacteriaceae bacterium]
MKTRKGTTGIAGERDTKPGSEKGQEMQSAENQGQEIHSRKAVQTIQGSQPASFPISALPLASPGAEGLADGGPSRQGEMTAEQEQLMIEHLPTVRYLARRIHERLPQHVEIEDLVSAGVLGLIDAFRKFDPRKKVQFRSYAQFRIRGAILDSLRTLDWSPRDLRRKGRAIEEAIRALTARSGRAPSEPEIAAEMGMELGEYQQLLGELKGLEIGTLHTEHCEDSGEEELAYIPNKPEEDPLFCCLKSEMQARLASAIDQLPERERLVMTLYYYEEMTMKEIGLTLGVVESRVSQIHASAILRLRSFLASLAPERRNDLHHNQSHPARM